MSPRIVKSLVLILPIPIIGVIYAIQNVLNANDIKIIPMFFVLYHLVISTFSISYIIYLLVI